MENRNERQRIGLESGLKELSKLIKDDQQAGRIRKERSLRRVRGMLGHLSSDKISSLVPRKIDTVEELYSFTEDEMLHKFRFYKEKTWIKLNDLLENYGLPTLNLPQEYTSDQ